MSNSTDSVERVPPPLTVRMKMAFGVGSTAEAITFQATNMFLLLFYNQVLGLSPGLVGLALSAGLIINAIVEPMVGSWSDRTRSKYGRRHPFLFASAGPIALCFYALFSPPEFLGPTGLLVWLTVVYVLLQQMLSLYEAPHLALGGELSDDYIERSSVMAYNTFFLWIGDTVAALVALKIFFKATAAVPNGALDASNYPSFALWTALTLFALRMFSAWKTAERIPYLSKTDASTPPFGPREFMGDILKALSNRNYVVLLFALLFFSLMTGVRNGLYIYKMTYYWQLNNDEIAWFVIGSLCGYVFAAFAVKRLHARFDKRWTGMAACLVYCVAPAIPLVLGYFGILGPESRYLIPILILFSLLQHAPYSILTTTIRSALADIADENELKHGLRQEGVLFAARTFFQRIDTALGTMLAGWALVLIDFPAKATPGLVDQDVLTGVAAVFILSTIPGLVATYFYGSLRVTRATYDATKAALAKNRAAIATETADARPLPKEIP